ncbi:MAG TPA: flagellar protein FlaG [Clostridiales bacterium]|nr:flagellar protein FlaG [Clostridiales bacterium]
MRIDGITSISNTKAVQSSQYSDVNRIFKNNSQSLNTLDNLDKREAKNERSQIDTLIGAVKDTNKMLEAYNRRFEISIHEGTKAIMVKVIDESTDEIIREIPPEKILDMVAALWEMAGIIVDRRI